MSVLRMLFDFIRWLFTGKKGLAGSVRDGPLETVLFNWTPNDFFTVRDLLTSISIFGASGSGKTSSSGKTVGRSLVTYPRSGGLIVAGKSDDTSLWTEIFTEAGRKDDLRIFSPAHSLRFNFIDYVKRLGGDALDIVHCIQILGETLQASGRTSASQEEFWRQAQDRMLYYAVLVVKLATDGKVTAPDLQRFITGAANSPEQLKDPAWANSQHRQYLEAAFNAPKTGSDAHDFQLAADYWLGEYPSTADRTRSSIVTGVMGTLHVFNTGIARTLISGDTNVSPDDMFNGKWILVNMTQAEWGIAGSFVSAGWKYLTQRAVLKRNAKPNDCINVIWCDEAHQVFNQFDATYLACCRSHLGCMCWLSQGLPGYYGAIQGESGRNHVDSLMGNFGHFVVHAVDPVTAEFASKKLGKQLESFFGGSSSPAADVYDDLFGEPRLTGSFNEHYEPVLQEKVFMSGLRTGGSRNGNVCDAIVIRSGRSFANGSNYLFSSFKQE